MNKQELINNVKAWGAWCTDHNTGEKDRYVKIDKVRELVEQLDEKQKVTVPKFVADWIEECKRNATLADCLKGKYEISIGRKLASEDFKNWVADNENDELTAKAWIFGYEAEKEPKFIVKVGNLYLLEPLGDTYDSTIRTTWNHKNAYKFTIYDMAQTHANKFGGEVEEVK